MNKQFVKVIVEVDENGNKKPLSLTFKDRVYLIDRLLCVQNAVAMKVGGVGERYKVRINGCETYIYNERGRWFVEEK